jgi:hypothetical protein
MSEISVKVVRSNGRTVEWSNGLISGNWETGKLGNWETGKLGN